MQISGRCLCLLSLDAGFEGSRLRYWLSSSDQFTDVAGLKPETEWGPQLGGMGSPKFRMACTLSATDSKQFGSDRAGRFGIDSPLLCTTFVVWKTDRFRGAGSQHFPSIDPIYLAWLSHPGDTQERYPCALGAGTQRGLGACHMSCRRGLRSRVHRQALGYTFEHTKDCLDEASGSLHQAA